MMGAISESQGMTAMSTSPCDHTSTTSLCGFVAVAILAFISAMCVTVLPLTAAEPTTAQVELFEKKVRPVLVERCIECHGEDSQEGELRVDSLAGLLKGGSRGPAVIPGDPKNSLLVRAVGHGETLQMPPKKKLPAHQIVDLGEWVRQGAPWPDQPLPPAAANLAATPGGKPLMVFSEAHRNHWALQPLRSPPLPTVRDPSWPRSPLDAFILAELDKSNLGPARRAERSTLLRRATFDLTGLPPHPADLHEFLEDDGADALSRVVDKLLASPRHGERYGRHWLDLSRYADSNGLDENLSYANAFRYRDYVISAFNRDKPFDRFVQEQIAGDLLAHPDLPSEFDGLVATGFLSLGAKMLAEDDPVKMQMDIIDEQIDTLGKCFLGLTLGCARCHDHKYDPVDMHDYYALAGIFKSTRTMVNHNVVAVWQERPIADRETLARRDALQRQAQAKRAEAAVIATKATDEILATARRRAGDYLYAAQVRARRQTLFANATPMGNSPADQLATIAGLKIIEAENYDRGNVLKDTTSYGNGIGVLVNRGELPNFAEYDLMIEEGGAYQFELRYAAAGARPCKVFVNGRPVLDNVAAQVTGSWNPDGQKWFVEGILDLPAGRVTMRLEQPQFFPHIDKLLISPAALLDGLTPVPAAGPMEALNLDLLQQWTTYLASTRDVPTSPLSVWHAVVGGRDLATLNDPTAKAITERLLAATAATPGELSKRYGRTWLAADDAWRALRATPEGANAKRLDDPVAEAFRGILYDPQGPFAAPKNIEPSFTTEIKQQLQQLRDQAAAIDKSMPLIPEAMAVSESKPENARIHFRGSHLSLGEEVARRFPRVVGSLGVNDAPDAITPGAIARDHSGRLELAHWLTQPDHPLTPRVIANRVWLWHFGQALVRSPDNFGLLGEKPTHPELLDWLARRLTSREWSLKQLHREIVLSATYAMSDAWDERAAAVDPENRLAWRATRRRLSAEEIRDAILAVSERLNYKMGGTNLPTPNRQYVTSTANVNPAIYDLACRSVYVPVVRSALYEVFQAFDFADPSVLAGQRESTTVAPQALFMMNSKITAEASRDLAEQLLAIPEAADADRVSRLYERAYARPARTEDTRRASEFLERYSTAVRGQTPSEGDVRRLAWRALCRAVLSANEFVYLD